MKSFIQKKYYWHAKNVYELVYGEMINMSQMRMISVLRRKAHKQIKEAISQVTFNGILHQVEFIRQAQPNNEATFWMNVYQTQKGLNGVNHKVEISSEEYQLLRYEPFYYFYSLRHG